MIDLETKKINTPQKRDIPNSRPATNQKKENSSILSDDVKKKINLGFNGAASAVNLLSFFTGNFFNNDSIQEKLDVGANFFNRLATTAQGVVNCTLAYEKKNLIAALGGILELPIAVLADGFNLFLWRGIAAGSNQFDGVVSSMPKIKDGKPILDKNGEKIFYENFVNEGWLEGLKITFKSVGKLTKELFSNPLKKDGLFPRMSFLCSSGMILGPLIYWGGLQSFGAGVRDLFGGAEALALMTHTNSHENAESKDSTKTKEKILKPKFSNFFLSGAVWTLGAATDYLKRLDFVSDKFKNMTELSLFLDRVGAIFYILGNQGTDKK